MYLNQTALARLEATSGWCFVLLITTLPWSIAPMSIAGAVFITATALLWAADPSRRWRPGLYLPAALAWLAASLAAALMAQDRAASLPRLGKALMPWLVLLAAYHAAQPRRGLRALTALLLSSAAASLIGIIFFTAGAGGLAGRARGPSGHYMTFGGQLLLLTSLAAGVVMTARSGRLRGLAGVTLSLGLFALGLTFTRSAWIATTVALGVIVGISRPRWLPVLIVGLAVCVVAAPPPYRDRLVSAFDPQHPSNVERTYMWSAGARMFRDHPITGVGLQDLKTIYERYRDPRARESAGHLHSVYVHIAATMGIVGLVAFAWLIVALFRVAGRGLRERLRQPDADAGVALGVIAGLAGFLVAGLFEWNFGDEELLWQLYLLVGLAWGAQRWRDPTPVPPVIPAPQHTRTTNAPASHVTAATEAPS